MLCLSEVSANHRAGHLLIPAEVIGQIVVGLTCDLVGRKTAMVGTTLLIVVGGILSTAASGFHSIWHVLDAVGCRALSPPLLIRRTVARGMTGVGVGGEYPACSTSASEVANEKFGRDRGKIFGRCRVASVADLR